MDARVQVVTWTSLRLSIARWTLGRLTCFARSRGRRGRDKRRRIEMTRSHFAACNGHFQVVEVLSLAHVGPQTRNKKGETALDEVSPYRKGVITKVRGYFRTMLDGESGPGLSCSVGEGFEVVIWFSLG